MAKAIKYYRNKVWSGDDTSSNFINNSRTMDI